jgi:hypothetical protein
MAFEKKRANERRARKNFWVFRAFLCAFFSHDISSLLKIRRKTHSPDYFWALSINVHTTIFEPVD